MEGGARYYRRTVALGGNGDFGRESRDFQVRATVRLSGKIEEKIDANSCSLGVIRNPAPQSIVFGYNIGERVLDRFYIQ